MQEYRKRYASYAASYVLMTVFVMAEVINILHISVSMEQAFLLAAISVCCLGLLLEKIKQKKISFFPTIGILRDKKNTSCCKSVLEMGVLLRGRTALVYKKDRFHA